MKQDIENNSQTPHVGHFPRIGDDFKDFGTHIIVGSKVVRLVAAREEFPSESEVGDFHDSLFDENVFWLQVSVGKGVILNEFEPREYLNEEFFRLLFINLVLLQELEEVPFLRQLHHQEYIAFHFDHLIDSDDIDVDEIVSDLRFELVVELIIVQFLIKMNLLDGHSTVDELVIGPEDLGKRALTNQFNLVVIFQLINCISRCIHI